MKLSVKDAVRLDGSPITVDEILEGAEACIDTSQGAVFKTAFSGRDGGLLVVVLENCNRPPKRVFVTIKQDGDDVALSERYLSTAVTTALKMVFVFTSDIQVTGGSDAA